MSRGSSVSGACGGGERTRADRHRLVAASVSRATPTRTGRAAGPVPPPSQGAAPFPSARRSGSSAVVARPSGRVSLTGLKVSARRPTSWRVTSSVSLPRPNTRTIPPGFAGPACVAEDVGCRHPQRYRSEDPQVLARCLPRLRCQGRRCVAGDDQSSDRHLRGQDPAPPRRLQPGRAGDGQCLLAPFRLGQKAHRRHRPLRRPALQQALLR